jgi:membrane protease YdiL (CAAX protease family)
METTNSSTTSDPDPALERQLARPGFWMAALLVVLVLGIQTILGLAAGITDAVCEQVLHLPSPQLERQPLVLSFINIVAIGAAIALGLYLNRLQFRRAFPIGRITAFQLLGVAVCVLGACVLLSDADNVLRVLLPPPQWLQEVFEDLFLSKDRLLARVFMLVLVAPVSEELLFRGIILRGLLSRYRPSVAVTLTALLFAALHMNPWQSLSALFLGILFGWFYWRTGSVALCVLAHAIANGMSILFTLLPLDIPGMTGMPDSTTTVFQPWWLDAAGAGVLAAGFWIFRRATPPASGMASMKTSSQEEVDKN